MTDGTATQQQPGRRRIIERPRLTRLLDESPARIKMLVAPAGYGKTTLARQWTASQAAYSWCRATAAAGDVASLVAAFATSAAQIVPGCNSRVAERLRVTNSAEADFLQLAEILIEDLAGWPSNAWLVIDDAQHVLADRATSSFVLAVVRDSEVNTLLCTRQRPSWVTARDLLYGNVLEIGRDTLAMTQEEAADVMRDTGAASGVVALADGWPAVLGLASLTPEPKLLSSMDARLPEALYDYLAEELYQALPPHVRDSMCLIAVAGVRLRRLVERLFPPRERDRTLRQVTEAGWLTADADSNLELHPLLQAFLLRKLDEEPVPEKRAKAKRVAEVLIAEQHWDEAFAVIERYGINDRFFPLVRSALEDLLSTGRIGALSNWIAYADRNSIAGPERDLALGELMFREGRFHESEVLALAAADNLPRQDDWASRAFATAGRAAHAANREREAFSHYGTARETAVSTSDLQVAAFGELSAAIDLELPEAPALLARLAPEADDIEGLVSCVSRWLTLHTRFGTFGDLQEARRVHRLLHLVSDPIVRCSFRNTYGYTVASAGDLEEAEIVIAAQLEDAHSYRLDFVVPYARLIEAVVELVRGRFDRVSALVDGIETAGRDAGDDLLTANSIAIRTRALIAQGRFKDAVSESLRSVGAVTPSMRGELLASRAIALACDRDDARALATAERAATTTRAVEARVGNAAARAIVAATRADSDVFALARIALGVARAQHCVECFISAYRGSPQLAHVLLDSEETREEMLLVLSIAGDLTLFRDLARGSASHGGTWEQLSPREREVLALVADGFSNREIGRTLYIAEATAKVHVSHILEKLGVASRTAAALRVPHHARSKPRLAQEPEAPEHP